MIWEEEEHPRVPPGSGNSGEFTNSAAKLSAARKDIQDAIDTWIEGMSGANEAQDKLLLDYINSAPIARDDTTVFRLEGASKLAKLEKESIGDVWKTTDLTSTTRDKKGLSNMLADFREMDERFAVRELRLRRGNSYGRNIQYFRPEESWDRQREFLMKPNVSFKLVSKESRVHNDEMYGEVKYDHYVYEPI